MTTRRSRGPDRERGSGTVWVAAFIVVLIVVGAGLAVVGAARVARHIAETAADLAALAGAQVLLDGSANPCRSAAAIAEVNGAELTDCAIAGETITVTVSRDVHLGRWGVGSASAIARAGPVLP